ncbi:MAG TPA: VOC family protein [Pelobium sp.]
MEIKKIVPCIWLTADGGKLAKVIAYYKAVFNQNLQPGKVITLGKTPSGYTELCEVEIFGQQYSLMNTELEHQPQTDAVSFMIYCEDQKEIDHFWDYFTQHGKEAECGWCIDKYGIRWQIIPKNLDVLMGKANSMEVMMKQKKIIISEYQD